MFRLVCLNNVTKTDIYSKNIFIPPRKSAGGFNNAFVRAFNAVVATMKFTLNLNKKEFNMSKTVSKFALAAGVVLAMVFTFSCSSDDGGGGGNEPAPSSNSSGDETVFCKQNSGACSQFSLSTCMELVNAGVAQIVSSCDEPPPPPPSSSSQSPSSNSGGTWYCDYGPRHTCFESSCENLIGGGCFEISGPNPGAAECDRDWGTITQSCVTTGDFCDYGPLAVDNGGNCGGTGYCGGCYKYASNCIADGGSRVSTCPASSLTPPASRPSSSSSAPQPSSSSQSPSSNSGGTWYCDYGPRHTCFESGCENLIGGGCFEISGPNPGAAECDREWATITQSCATSGDFCDYGPLTVDNGGSCGGTGYCGGCYKYASNCIADSGSRVSTCPASSLTVSGGGTQNTFTDTRDNKTYKIAVIGTQTWMAENLNYNPSTGNSACYDNQASYCTTYGRLYDWATAMGFNASCNSSSCSSQIQSKHKGVCPSGWHIPNSEDWGKLSRYADGTSGTFAGYVSSTAGRYLKATSSWSFNGNGTNDYGFSALPGGGSYEYGLLSVGMFGQWWSASESKNYSGFAYSRSISYIDEEADWIEDVKSYLSSVRCLQD